MLQSEQKPFSLVPEIVLLQSLEPHLKKRFEKALELMHNNLDERLTWEQIAEESAISPYHFHRQFSQLFNQTPGQYLSRTRLQLAVYYLLHNQKEKVTSIAHKCGFSSSQALAKVLKRELGETAKSLRQRLTKAPLSETMTLMESLAHPPNPSLQTAAYPTSSSLEKQLADAMPVELVFYPNRSIELVEFSSFDWDRGYEKYQERVTDFLVSTPVSQLEKSWEEIRFVVGNWRNSQQNHKHVIAEGYYLCCEVYVASDVAYLEAIDGLFRHAKKLELDVDTKGEFVEMMRHIEPHTTGGAVFAFQLPIR